MLYYHTILEIKMSSFKYVGTEREGGDDVVKHSDHEGGRGKTLVTTITWQTCILIQTFII